MHSAWAVGRERKNWFSLRGREALDVEEGVMIRTTSRN